MPDTASIVVRRHDHPSGQQHECARACRGGRARLVLVTCSDMGRLDMILRPAIARLDRSCDTILLEPIGTATLPAGSGERLRRSAFDAIAASGDLVLSWQDAGRRFGYDTALLRALQAGLTVVAPARAACDIDLQARNLCRHITVVHVEPGTDPLRSSLSTPRYDVRLRDPGNIASAVRALSETLRPFMPLERVAARLTSHRTRPSTDRQPKAPARTRRNRRPETTTANLRSPKRAGRPQARATSPT